MIRNPVITKKTSTPPETLPNQMWYAATSSAATVRRPSISSRFVDAGAGRASFGELRRPAASAPEVVDGLEAIEAVGAVTGRERTHGR
ncbi:hypothetical protein GCM10009761_14430 [Agromyces terreus]